MVKDWWILAWITILILLQRGLFYLNWLIFDAQFHYTQNVLNQITWILFFQTCSKLFSFIKYIQVINLSCHHISYSLLQLSHNPQYRTKQLIRANRAPTKCHNIFYVMPDYHIFRLCHATCSEFMTENWLSLPCRWSAT